MGCKSSRDLDQDDRGSLLDTRSAAASVNRTQLLGLSRKHLRRRLRDVDAAPSEGEGLGFSGLVDTVLLWNVLTQIRDGSRREKMAALRAIKEEDISLGVLQRGLIVTGFQQSEWRNLKKQEVAKLLHKTLAVAADCDESDDSDSDRSNHCQLIETIIDDDVADARMREWQQLCCESRMAKAEPEDGDGSNAEDLDVQTTKDGSNACDLDMQVQEDSASEADGELNSSPLTAGAPDIAEDQQKNSARDAKFNALDAELGACLGSHVEISIAELHLVSPCMADSRKQNQRKSKRRKVKREKAEPRL